MNLNELTKKDPFDKPIITFIDKDDKVNVTNRTILVVSSFWSIFLEDSQTLMKEYCDKYGPLSISEEDGMPDLIKDYYIPHICSFIKVLTNNDIQRFTLSEEDVNKILSYIKKVIEQVKNGKYLYKKLADEGDEDEDLLNAVHCLISISIVSEDEISKDKFFDILENTAIVKEEFFVIVNVDELIITLDENGNKVRTYSKIEL